MSAKRKPRARRWITVIIIIAAAVAAVSYFAKPKPSVYESVEAKDGDITAYYSFSGNIDTKNRQTVTSEKAMQISSIKVKEGQVVREGDTLFTTTAGERIKAKIGGEVSNINVEEKATVMAGVKLMEVVDYDNLEIKVKVDEYDIGAIQEGRETDVRIGALDKNIKGTVSSISKEGQIANGITYFTAAIDLGKDESLRIGMSAEVKLISGQVSGVVTLPMKAIQFDSDNKPYVFKKGEKGLPVRTDITTGINDGTTVEIKNGLSSGETVLYTDSSTSSGMGFRMRRNNNNNNSSNSNRLSGGDN